MATETDPRTENQPLPRMEITTNDVGEPVVLGPASPGPSQAAGAAAGAAVVAAQQAGVPNAERGDPDAASPEHVREEVEDEVIVWEARYSPRNFLGRLTGMGLLTVGWIALAIYTWGGYSRGNEAVSMDVVAGIAGVVLGLMWLALFWRMIHALFGHYYRLTNRRLFVSTGLFVRRRDQMELLRVQDVFTRQSFYERILGLGTVIVNSSEQSLPVVYLAGVDDPKGVMDMVWRCSRAEREGTAVQVDQI